MTQIIAEKFSKNKSHFILQPLLAAGFVVIALAVLGGFQHVDLLGFIGTTALGSSAFSVFSMPSNPIATMRKMWGGYAISFIIGGIFSAFIFMLEIGHVHLASCFCAEIAALLAMAVTMFLMAILGCEHPPAAGLALGLAVESWTFSMLFVVVTIIILMSFVKYLLRNWLIDLV